MLNGIDYKYGNIWTKGLNQVFKSRQVLCLWKVLEFVRYTFKPKLELAALQWDLTAIF